METKESILTELDILKYECKDRQYKISKLENKLKKFKVSKFERFRKMFENCKVDFHKSWNIYHRGFYNYGGDVEIDREVIKQHKFTDIWRVSDFVVEIFKSEYNLTDDEICNFIQEFYQNVYHYKCIKVITNKVTATENDFKYTELDRYKKFDNELNEIIKNNNIPEGKLFQHLIPYKNKTEEIETELKHKEQDISLYNSLYNKKINN